MVYFILMKMRNDVGHWSVLAKLLLFTAFLAQSVRADVYISTAATNETNTTYIGLAYTSNFSSISFAVAKFLGIPYAQSVSGTKRFSLPVLTTPLAGKVYEATKLGSMCPQPYNPLDPCINSLIPFMNEDCLYLNIYVPLPNVTSADVQSGVNMTLPSGKKYPVLFYIHGGGYYTGTGNCYNGTNLAGIGEIIVVTSNYRLGMLGFLATGDNVIPGNLALWDQLTALTWVHQNIAAFGGDPTTVTVGGNSAGGVFATFLALFPRPGPELFQRILALSGTAAFSKSVTMNGYEVALTLSKNVGCNLQGQPSSADIKSCLMAIPVQNLTDVTYVGLYPLTFPVQLTLDEPLVPSDPFNFLSVAYSRYVSKQLSIPASFYNKDLLLGVVSEDGSVLHLLKYFVLSNAVKNMTLFQEMQTKTMSLADFKTVIFEFMAKSFTEKADTYKVEINTIIDRYIPWEDPTNTALQSNRLVSMLTDLGFNLPMADTALAHVLGPLVDKSSTKGSTYLYKLSKWTTSPEYQQLISWFQGTEHDADIPFIFGTVTDSDDVRLSKTWMTYLTNFVKTGNPNQAGLVSWKEYDVSTQSYLYISTNVTQQRNYFAASAQHFMYDLIPSLKDNIAKNSIPCNTGFWAVRCSGLFVCLLALIASCY